MRVVWPIQAPGGIVAMPTLEFTHTITPAEVRNLQNVADRLSRAALTKPDHNPTKLQGIDSFDARAANESLWQLSPGTDPRGGMPRLGR